MKGIKSKDSNVVFPGGGSPSKKTRYLSWVRKNFPDLSPDTPGLRKRYDDLCEYKRNEFKNLFNGKK